VGPVRDSIVAGAGLVAGDCSADVKIVVFSDLGDFTPETSVASKRLRALGGEISGDSDMTAGKVKEVGFICCSSDAAVPVGAGVFGSLASSDGNIGGAKVVVLCGIGIERGEVCSGWAGSCS